MEHPYAIAAVTEFHGEHQLTSTIDDALHMPYPDASIVYALTQQHILDEQQGLDIIAFACTCDCKLTIQSICFEIFSSQILDSDSDSDDNNNNPDDKAFHQKDQD
ncbi:hypothetical protein EV424DRAFT_1534494 [Suillus variegatus]|nr:hypothetical protein EV424DRAFT_1534494 [Suillus variegatus]